MFRGTFLFTNECNEHAQKRYSSRKPALHHPDPRPLNVTRPTSTPPISQSFQRSCATSISIDSRASPSFSSSWICKWMLGISGTWTWLEPPRLLVALQVSKTIDASHKFRPQDCFAFFLRPTFATLWPGLSRAKCELIATLWTLFSLAKMPTAQSILTRRSRASKVRRAPLTCPAQSLSKRLLHFVHPMFNCQPAGQVGSDRLLQCRSCPFLAQTLSNLSHRQMNMLHSKQQRAFNLSSWSKACGPNHSNHFSHVPERLAMSCPASHSLIVQPTRRGLEGRESTDVTLVSFRNIRSVRSVRHSGANVGGRRGAMAFHRAPHVRSKKQDKQTNQQAVFETNRYNSVKHIRISNTAVFTAPSLEYLFEKKGDVCDNCGAEMRSRLGVSPATESTQGDLMGARWWQTA